MKNNFRMLSAYLQLSTSGTRGDVCRVRCLLLSGAEDDEHVQLDGFAADRAHSALEEAVKSVGRKSSAEKWNREVTGLLAPYSKATKNVGDSGIPVGYVLRCDANEPEKGDN